MSWTGISVLCLAAIAVIVLILNRSRSGGNDISQSQLVEWKKQEPELCILDVRSADEYNSGHITGSINISHKEIFARLDELMPYKDRKVVVYCEGGIRARVAQIALVKAGFTNVFHLTGDMHAWRQAGLPINTPGART